MSLTPSNMATATLKIGDLFGEKSVFVVPRFQRNYEWELDQLTEFWDDLYGHYLDWQNGHEQTQYYFGSLMLIRENPSQTTFQVVDGQQRLTTCMIFLMALRDFYIEHKLEDEVNSLNEIISYMDQDNKRKPRLKLNRYNDHYFKNILYVEQDISIKNQSFPKRIDKNHKNLKNCYAYFYKIFTGTGKDDPFKEFSLEEKVETFRDLLEHLLSHFEVVSNIFSSKQRAYRIFEAINHKGKRLSENDLVKNYIFEQIDDSKSVEDPPELIDADNQWEKISSILKDAKIAEDKCLRFHLTAFNGKTPIAKIFEKISENVKDKEQAKTFLNELESTANFLSELKKPTSKFWKEDQHVLDNLRGYSSMSDGGMYPILIAANKKFNENTKIENLKIVIEFITKLHFRAKTICGISYTQIEQLVNDICAIIRDEKRDFSIDPMESIKNKILTWNGYPDTEKFEMEFKEFQSKQDSVLRYALIELEYNKIGGRKMSGTIIRSDIEAEHIMPKSIDKWIPELKKIPELKDADENKIKKYQEQHLYKLGNITLVSPRANKEYSDKPFTIKKNGEEPDFIGYRDETIKITSNLNDETKWTDKEIDARQERFADKATKIWDLKLID